MVCCAMVKKKNLMRGINHEAPRYAFSPASYYFLQLIAKYLVKRNKSDWKARMSVKKKVNCTLVQALRLCTSRTAHRRSRGIAILFHDHGTRRRCQPHAPAALYPGKDPVPIVQEAGWAPGPVWTGAENLAPHRDSIPGPSSP